MPAAATRRPVEETFEIHEDAMTEETEMMVDEDDQFGGIDNEIMDRLAMEATMEQFVGEHDHEQEQEQEHEQEQEEEPEEDEEEEEADEAEESSDDEQVESSVQADMNKLQTDFPGFRDKYRLIKRIGEGV